MVLMLTSLAFMRLACDFDRDWCGVPPEPAAARPFRPRDAGRDGLVERTHRAVDCSGRNARSVISMCPLRSVAGGPLFGAAPAIPRFDDDGALEPGASWRHDDLRPLAAVVVGRGRVSALRCPMPRRAGRSAGRSDWRTRVRSAGRGAQGPCGRAADYRPIPSLLPSPSHPPFAGFVRGGGFPQWSRPSPSTAPPHRPRPAESRELGLTRQPQE
jgi:hypothetical protein